ncbi:hypothetical protein OPW39_10825 [Vibrio europaeus]|uniref:calcium-binding protein n=4 Tax=Vibrio TaxID=662 RepID=UPI00233EE10F|nr:calcium-binding protein [Vibrio europaeus]MDC5869323.1 hypothetical protein [Vibrio europaeus]
MISCLVTKVTDTLTVSGRGSNSLDGGEGDDTLTVSNNTDYRYQRDVLSHARNTLAGGKGNDRLVGHAGAETYLFNRGDGQDTIRDYDHRINSSSEGWNKTDRIVLGEGIRLEELSLRRDGNHMVLVIGGLESGDSITIENAYTDKRYRIEEIELADGSSVAPYSLPLIATAGDDVVQGSGYAETLDLQAGNDTFHAEGGDDRVQAGLGNDVVHAGSGNDEVHGGLGDDTLHGQDGNDQLFGDQGNDTLTVSGRGSNTLDGGEGDDTLTVSNNTDYRYQRDVLSHARNTLAGGKGNDRLEGHAGAETYLFNRGDGQDTIRDYDHRINSSSDGWNKTDRIVLGEGIRLEELSLRRDGNHMVLVIGGLESGDSITIENAYTDKRYRIEEIELADGSRVAPYSLPLFATAGDDVVQGSGYAEKVELQAGDDVVHAGSGNDEVHGGLGDDTLHGQDGNDQLFGDQGNDTLTVSGRGSNSLDGGEGDDTLTVSNNTDYRYQRDVLSHARNTLAGGKGNDRLEGHAGAETYLFNRGDGQDTIRDYDHRINSSSDGWNKTDRIVLGEGIRLEELSLRRDGNHMVLVIGGLESGDSITIENAYTDKRYRIEEIELADGSRVAPYSLPLFATAGDDVVQGSGYAEKVELQAGDDVVHAGSGNDEVHGGLGDDTLHGQDGNDQLFGDQGNDTLTVSGRGSNSLDGGEGDDTLTVSNNTDYRYQRDVLSHARNTLAGGKGNDRLVGHAGAETYLFNRGDGQDTIRDYDHRINSSSEGWNKTDRIVLGEGIHLEELSLRRDGNHMVLVIGGLESGDSITIENAYTDKRYRIEEIKLADGSSVAPYSLPLIATAGDDVVQGSGYAETLDLQAGNDTFHAEGGDDRVQAGLGNDVVHAGSGNDEVHGGLGDDTLHGQDGNDQLFGDQGNDTLTVSGRGSNTLDGGEGDDTLTVSNNTDYRYQRDVLSHARNTLAGGKGNDRLVGHAGAETYLFNRGDGQDTIRDYDHRINSSSDGWNKTDRIVLGEGIRLEELSLRRDGNHMVLVVGGLESGDSITIENAYTDKRYRIEEIELADGSRVAPYSLPLFATAGDDVVQGSGYAEKVELQAGDDVVHAGSGNDEVHGGLGDDTLHGQDGNDQLFGDQGNDTLTVSGRGSNSLDGGEGDDTLTVSNNTDYRYQRDVLSHARNTLAGGKGNDRLEGHAGAETYLFNRGDGQDTIRDYDHRINSSSDGWNKTDRIVLGEGIRLEELSLRRDGNHMVLVIGGLESGDSITIENAYTDKRYRIEEIELADGSRVAPYSLPLFATAGDDVVQGSGYAEKVELQAGDDVVHAGSGNDEVYGGLGDDTLHGQDGNDQLFGDQGNDTLTVSGRGSNSLDGGEGDDTLTVSNNTDYRYQRDVLSHARNTLAGGKGNDRLEGHAGAETYLFNRGDGQDTIRDYDHRINSSSDGWNKTDRIVLGEGIRLEELSLRRDGNHMVLVIGGLESGDSITIENAYTDKRYRIEEVVLSEGSKVSPFDLPDYVEPVIETDLLVQAMSAFDAQESVANNAVIDSVASSLSPNVVVSGQSSL